MIIRMNDARVSEILADRVRAGADASRLRNYRRTVPACAGRAGAIADGEWAGQPCFIVGGGPSLKGFDFERLRGRGRVIVINRAFESVPFADIVFFMDNGGFYQKIFKGTFGPLALPKWEAFPGRKVFLNLSAYEMGKKIIPVPSLGMHGLSPSIEQGLYHGNNSGAGAIGLAYCLGANPIYLLGFDCLPAKAGETHFHDGYGKRLTESTAAQFINSFEDLARRIAKTGAKVINLNHKSALRCFAFGDIDQVLS